MNISVKLSGTFQQQVQEVYDALVKQHLTALAKAWKSFAANIHKKDPKLTVKQILDLFTAQYAGQALSRGLSSAVSGGATAVAQAAQGASNAAENLAGIPASIVSGIGGAFASALESGFLALIKDIWDVIIGPAEIIIGGVIIILALYLAFRNDLAITPLAGR